MVKHYQIAINYPNASAIRQMVYHEWGNPDNPKVLICVHGLTRNGRDFDYLAQALMEDYRVICPDIVGRGDSDWLTEPQQYGLPLYVSDIITLCQQLSLTQVDWIGTSMGGLIGMLIASQFPHLIRKLVLNDVGTFISQNFLVKIAKFFSEAPRIFDNFEQVLEYVRLVYAPFGELTDAQWQHLAIHSVKTIAPGKYRLHYDPNIAIAFQSQIYQEQNLDFGQYWVSVSCPVLLLHGEKSDLLTPEIIYSMQESYSQLQVANIPNCGHAPALMDTRQIELIKAWLNNLSLLKIF